MQIHTIECRNSLRNFNYLIACRETGDALVVDPLNVGDILDRASRENLNIKAIINTHEHFDHTQGNRELQAATQARIYALAAARGRIPGLTHEVRDGDHLQIGETVQATILDTPGHTMAHLCLLVQNDKSPALFSGDTLFNAGCGNCYNGGDPAALYETFYSRLYSLPSETNIYPGHDYIENNLQFTLDREPDNQAASALLETVQKNRGGSPCITSLAVEKEINVFFRLGSKSLQSQLKKSFPGLKGPLTPKEVFIKLRSLRNQW